MAMGMGSHHHKGNSINGSSRSSSGKPYGLMLLLAFGAALLGVMVLHKLRERRIFTLLLKDKDSQLISLQLLSQKEREYGKEMKRKNEEMKAKLYLLRTQKMELDRRHLEMKSTIDSLKDEQKAIESTLEEKQNEIKMQREQIDAIKENSQLIDLKEILNRKEAEIEDLRHHLDIRVNFTDTSNVAEKDKSETSSSKEAGGELHESAKFIDGENSTRVDDRSEKSEGDTNGREITVENLEKPEISQDEGAKSGGGVVEKGIDDSEGERKNISNSREKIVDDQGIVLNPRDNTSDVKDGIEHTITRERELEKPENSHEQETEDVRVTSSRDGMKLEMLDSNTRSRGKHGNMNRTKGKRWRTLAKNRVSENKGAASMRSRRFYRSAGEASIEGIEISKGKETGENPRKVRNMVDTKLRTLQKKNADPNQQLQQENEMSKKFQNSPDREVLMVRKVNEAASNISIYAEKQVTNEIKVEQPEEESSGIQQKLISRDIYEEENMAKQVKDSSKVQLTDDFEAAYAQESETGAANSDSTEESASKSNMDEDEEEYKEETNESEF